MAARLQAAAALAADGRAPVLDADNHVERWLRIEDAVEADEPFFIVPEPSVLAVDFDKAGSSHAAIELYLRLRLAGLPALLCNSGGGQARDPHRHVFALTASASELEHWRDVAHRLQGDVRSTGIRPPWTRHRDGRSRSWPLGDISEKEVISRLSGELRRDPLDPAQVARIIDGTGAFTDRSHELVEVITVLIEHGWPKWEILMLLTFEGFRSGQTYEAARTDRRHRGDHGWFEDHLYPDAKDRAVPERELLRRRVARLRTLRLRQILHREEDVASRVVDIKTMELFLSKVELLGRWSITMASRTLQQEARIGSPTTSTRSLWRLLEARMIRRDRGARRVKKAHRAHTYLVVEPAADELEGIPETPPLVFLLDDVFRQGKGDGPGTGLAYCFLVLHPEGLTAGDVAILCASTVKTARRRLDRLLEPGFAQRKGDLYSPGEITPVPGMYPEATAARLRAERRHHHEREAWRSRDDAD